MVLLNLLVFYTNELGKCDNKVMIFFFFLLNFVDDIAPVVV